MRPREEDRVYGATNPVRSINRLFGLLRLSPSESNDNADPRAKVLPLKRPPRAPRVLYVVTVSVPPDVNDWLCRASGFTAGETAAAPSSSPSTGSPAARKTGRRRWAEAPGSS